MDKAQLEQTRQAALMVEVLAQQDSLATPDILQPQLDMLVHRTNIAGISILSGLNSISADESTDVITYVWMMPTENALALQKKRL